MYKSRRSPRRRMMLVINLILAGLCVYIGLRIEPINRRIEAFPYYARTYINKFRPKPELPAPPAVSEFDPDTLLQVRNEALTVSELSAESNPDGTAVAEADPVRPAEVQLVASSHIETAPVAPAVTLTGVQHEWQTWNNCGPVTIAMNLSYYGRTETQVDSAPFLKPNQDDKNVNPAELAAYARSLGFDALVRVGGDVTLLKHLLSNSIPVIVETWLDPEDNGGLGHYRLFTGYDEAQDNFIAQDSLRGANLKVPVAEFEPFWQVFNRKYVVVYRPDQTALIHAILGKDGIDQTMFEQALLTAQNEAKSQPGNAFAWFNIGTNYTHLAEPDLAASAFDEARRLGLPYRMLWYQFEIFEAYLAVGRYQEVVDLATATLQATGGLEELYYYRGLAQQALNRSEAAADDFRAALDYNPNFTLAAEALATVESPS